MCQTGGELILHAQQVWPNRSVAAGVAQQGWKRFGSAGVAQQVWPSKFGAVGMEKVWRNRCGPESAAILFTRFVDAPSCRFLLTRFFTIWGRIVGEAISEIIMVEGVLYRRRKVNVESQRQSSLLQHFSIAPSNRIRGSAYTQGDPAAELVYFGLDSVAAFPSRTLG